MHHWQDRFLGCPIKVVGLAGCTDQGSKSSCQDGGVGMNESIGEPCLHLEFLNQGQILPGSSPRTCALIEQQCFRKSPPCDRRKVGSFGVQVTTTAVSLKRFLLPGIACSQGGSLEAVSLYVSWSCQLPSLILTSLQLWLCRRRKS